MKSLGYILAVIFAILFFWQYTKKQDPIVKTVTKTEIEYRDTTIYVDRPVPVTREVVKEVTAYLPGKTDTVLVEVRVPIEKVTFEGKIDTVGTYYAEVSGYQPVLDLIKFDLHFPTIKETTTITKRPRLNLGLQAGIGVQYGLKRKQVNFGPYVGVGLQYNF